MKRRKFLQITLATAGGVLVGCGEGSPGDSSQGVDGAAASRRRDLEPALLFDETIFPQSVASGDPKPGTVVLWTRVVDEAKPGEDLDLRLEVALDESFSSPVLLDGETSLSLVAEASFDHCVKVRVEALSPATTYYYRFIYHRDDESFASRVGRTRTAPGPDEDIAVRFAVVSCQDYVGRYYNVLRQLAQEEFDFFIHLGDYVYETTGDSLFQLQNESRRVVFSEPEDAIVFHEGTDNEYQGARSLSNYRDLYKLYRQDPHLQRVHERFAMVAIWDDHEFSDDHFGQTATYYDGAQDEFDAERRQAADQAWFEYMPVDYPAGSDFVFDPDEVFPENLEIYRDFTFGQHLHLVMTDLRRYRSDHVIAEDAMPGAVAVSEDELLEVLGEVPDSALAYVDLDTFKEGSYQTFLMEHATALGWESDDFQGLMSLAFIEDLWADAAERLPEGSERPPLPDETERATLPRGYAYHQVLKTGRYSSIGSRSLVISEAFEKIAAVRWAKSSGNSEIALGEAQRAWFKETMNGSTGTWKVWGSAFMLMPKQIDLRGYAFLPEEFQTRFYLSAEDWDGQPNRRDEILAALSGVENFVTVSGDIHAFFVGEKNFADTHVFEFVTGATTSTSYQTMLIQQAEADPGLAAVGAPALAASAQTLLTHPDARPNPHMAYAALDKHGFILIDLDAQRLEASLFQIPEAESESSHEGDDDALRGKFDIRTFRIDNGSTVLQMSVDGQWRAWNPDAYRWE